MKYVLSIVELNAQTEYVRNIVYNPFFITIFKVIILQWGYKHRGRRNYISILFLFISVLFLIITIGDYWNSTYIILSPGFWIQLMFWWILIKSRSFKCLDPLVASIWYFLLMYINRDLLYVSTFFDKDYISTTLLYIYFLMCTITLIK